METNEPAPITAKEKMRLANAVTNWEHPLVPQTRTPDPTPMTEIRFENGSTVTIRDGWIQAPSPTMTAMLNALAATLSGYGIPRFKVDADFNIARGIIERVGSISAQSGSVRRSLLLSIFANCDPAS